MSSPEPTSRLMKRAERVKEVVPLSKVLAHYGYLVNGDETDREQIFPCDLHGDGVDLGASAKLYTQSSSNSFFCWGCGRVRDSIALVREKQNLSFSEAISWLEKQYELPNLPWEISTTAPKEKIVEKAVEAVFDTHETVHDVLKRVSKFLSGIVSEQSLPDQRCAAYWETHDKLVYMLDHLPADKIKQASVVLLETLKKELHSGHTGTAQ